MCVNVWMNANLFYKVLYKCIKAVNVPVRGGSVNPVSVFVSSGEEWVVYLL